MNTTDTLLKLNNLLLILKLENVSEAQVIKDAIKVMTEQHYQIKELTESRDFWKKQFNDLAKSK